MNTVTDPATKLEFPNPAEFPLTKDLPDQDQLAQSLDQMILSASGWRKVFAPNGNEESNVGSPSITDLALAFGMGLAFGKHLLQRKRDAHPKVILGMDSRPTGPLLAQSMGMALLSIEIQLEWASVLASPQIMSHVQQSQELAGFVYISASHNPVGHNGVKFGRETGGVLSAEEAKVLIEEFRSLVMDGTLIKALKQAPWTTLLKSYKELMDTSEETNQRTALTYWDFTKVVWANSTSAKDLEAYHKKMNQSLKTNPLGVIAEFNGSARGTSIDKKFLEDFGVKVKTFHETPGDMVHRIVPEGSSLDLCCSLVEKHQNDGFVLGYVPDCDGDRGNLVYWDEKEKKAGPIEAQNVFALSVLSELAYLVYNEDLTYDEAGFPQKRFAVVVNGPTSMRVDELADTFRVPVFRAEVGEANVVTLAENLRKQGYTVRILGEGSNGGNITHPSRVRDPLNTLGAIIKLLTIVGTKSKPGLFALYQKRLGLTPKKDFTLRDILDTIPRFTTTSAYEDKAIMRIKARNHAQLKSIYEELLISDGWSKHRNQLKEEYGIVAWEEINYEGSEERHGFGPPFRSGSEKGGLKILLKNSRGERVAFMWMRGSGTEPVFRVMVDVKGEDTFAEDFLLAWHVSMIQQADLKCL